MSFLQPENERDNDAKDLILDSCLPMPESLARGEAQRCHSSNVDRRTTACLCLATNEAILSRETHHAQAPNVDLSINMSLFRAIDAIAARRLLPSTAASLQDVIEWRLRRTALEKRPRSTAVLPINRITDHALQKEKPP